jgi:hypothetical protein
MLLFNSVKENEMGSSCGTHDVITQLYSVNLKRKIHLGEPGIDARIILNFVLNKENSTHSVLNWFRIGFGDSAL